MHNALFDESAADKEVIASLLRELNRRSKMSKYFRDEDGKLYRATSYELVTPEQLQETANLLSSELEAVQKLLPTPTEAPVPEQPQAEAPVAEAVEQAAVEEAPAQPAPETPAEQGDQAQVLTSAPAAEAPASPLHVAAQPEPEQPATPPLQ